MGKHVLHIKNFKKTTLSNYNKHELFLELEKYLLEDRADIVYYIYSEIYYSTFLQDFLIFAYNFWMKYIHYHNIYIPSIIYEVYKKYDSLRQSREINQILNDKHIMVYTFEILINLIKTRKENIGNILPDTSFASGAASGASGKLDIRMERYYHPSIIDTNLLNYDHLTQYKNDITEILYCLEKIIYKNKRLSSDDFNRYFNYTYHTISKITNGMFKYTETTSLHERTTDFSIEIVSKDLLELLWFIVLNIASKMDIRKIIHRMYALGKQMNKFNMLTVLKISILLLLYKTKYTCEKFGIENNKEDFKKLLISFKLIKDAVSNKEKRSDYINFKEIAGDDADDDTESVEVASTVSSNRTGVTGVTGVSRVTTGKRRFKTAEEEEQYHKNLELQDRLRGLFFEFDQSTNDEKCPIDETYTNYRYA